MRKSKPYWKIDIEYALSKGVSLKLACAYAEISYSQAWACGYKGNRHTIHSKINLIIEDYRNGYSFHELSKKYGYNANYILQTIVSL